MEFCLTCCGSDSPSPFSASQLLSMAAQKVMKHRSFLEEGAPKLATNLQITLGSVFLVNKCIIFFYVDKLLRSEGILSN